MVGSVSFPFIHLCKYSTLTLDNHIFGSKGKWSWCSDVYFTSGRLQRVNPGSGTSFHLYLMPFVPKIIDTNFTTQIWKRWGTIVVICSNVFKSTMSQSFMCNIHISYSKYSTSLWLVFFLKISLGESVILIPYIIQTVAAWAQPVGNRVLFLTLVCDYDSSLISHPTFILDSISRSSSNQF